MAPEVLRLERYSEAADVWSFGVVMWELSTGLRPFEGINPLRVIYMVTHGERLQLPDDLPKRYRDLLLWCWEEPEDRPTFTQIIEVIDELRFTDAHAL